jgi:hypothetical protein
MLLYLFQSRCRKWNFCKFKQNCMIYNQCFRFRSRLVKSGTTRLGTDLVPDLRLINWHIFCLCCGSGRVRTFLVESGFLGTDPDLILDLVLDPRLRKWKYFSSALLILSDLNVWERVQGLTYFLSGTATLFIVVSEQH